MNESIDQWSHYVKQCVSWTMIATTILVFTGIICPLLRYILWKSIAFIIIAFTCKFREILSGLRVMEQPLYKIVSTKNLAMVFSGIFIHLNQLNWRQFESLCIQWHNKEGRWCLWTDYIKAISDQTHHSRGFISMSFLSPPPTQKEYCFLKIVVIV